MRIIEGEYKLTKWKAYEGDCIKILNKDIKDETIDCVVTSPPYWGRRSYGQKPIKDGNVANWMYAQAGKPFEAEIGNNCVYEKYIYDLKMVFSSIFNKLKHNKFFFINISNIHKNKELVDMSYDFIKIAKEVGFNHWDTIIWIKRNSMPPGKHKHMYLSNGWEYVLVFTKGKDFTINTDNYLITNSHLKCTKCGEENWIDFKYYPNYFYSNVGCFGRKREPLKSHPAIFPIELPEFCFRIATNENDTVLDPFAGSGTTLIAGLQLGLNAIGCELIPDIYDNLIEELNKLDMR